MANKKMGVLDLIAYVLVIIGAINWGLVGLANFDLVTFVFRIGWLIKAVYLLVGASGLYSLYTLYKLYK